MVEIYDDVEVAEDRSKEGTTVHDMNFPWDRIELNDVAPKVDYTG